MTMFRRHTRNRSLRLMSAALLLQTATSLPLIAGESTNRSGPVQQGTTSGDPTDYLNNVPAVTISLTGQTALRNFTSSQGATTLAPGSSATFYFGDQGTPVTYYAPNNPSAYVQLAKKDFTTPDEGLGATSVANAPVKQQHSALRLEWHEQGSVQGLIDLVNDQVGFTTGPTGTGPLSNASSRGPSTANPTWINSTSFTTGGTQFGHQLVDGNYNDTYDRLVYDRVTGSNKIGIQYGGQNRSQIAIGEYKTENFSVPGTPSAFALPGQSGFGQGNPALLNGANRLGLGTPDSRQAFLSESAVNQSTDKVDPESASDQKYQPGPWNSAGANNITSQQIAVTAVAYAANPGTGLYRLNKGDTQWLLTTGRLGNGADFNVVLRENAAGQRTVPAVNVGIDPSWAVGENDGGNTGAGGTSADTQRTVGPGIRFSGKTSGTAAREVIAQSRLGFGPLSLAETRGAADNAPVRALDVDFENLTDSGNAADFKRVTFDNIVDFSYKAVLVSHYNTIKSQNVPLLNEFRTGFQQANGRAPTSQEEQTWWNGLTSAETGIKGDPFGNVESFIKNIVQSKGTGAPGLTPATANNPADAIYAAGYLTPGLLNYFREFDSSPLVPRTLSAAEQQIQQNVKTNYGASFTADGTNGANSQTIGKNAYYTSRNAGGSPQLNGDIKTLTITAKDDAGNTVENGINAPKGNFLFGNFNQDGRRDYASVKEAVNAALSLRKIDGAANSIYFDNGGVNTGTVIPSLVGSPGWASTANTKADLVILGDFNTDGAFDGKDLYLLARGASLSDGPGTDHLTTASGATFADQVRNPNARLNKNAALDYVNAQLSNPANADQAFLRTSASASVTNDPNGLNAFNKFDVNRDGLVDQKDVWSVHEFIGSDYRQLDDQLGAVIGTDGAPLYADPTTSTKARRSISLVDLELTDDGVIDYTNDFQLIATQGGANGTPLVLLGDAELDQDVDISDFIVFASNYNSSSNYNKWSRADFDGNAKTELADFGIWAKNYGSPITAGLLEPYVGADLATTLFNYYQNLGQGTVGDYNGDGVLDASDLDLQSTAIASQNLAYDLTGDGAVNIDDRLRWVNVLKKTWIGDSNLDGEFNTGDFVEVFTVGKFELAVNATWSEGDWNGDQRFDTTDLIVAFQEGGFEGGPRASIAAVPEPATATWIGLLSLLVTRWMPRRRRA